MSRSEVSMCNFLVKIVREYVWSAKSLVWRSLYRLCHTIIVHTIQGRDVMTLFQWLTTNKYFVNGKNLTHRAHSDDDYARNVHTIFPEYFFLLFFSRHYCISSKTSYIIHLTRQN